MIETLPHSIAPSCSTFSELTAANVACQACSLREGVKGPVPGAGNSAADIMFVGEAPGRNEDETGIPFSGVAGDMLTRIVNAVGQTRDDVYITNIVRCRPPDNRDPVAEEVDTCGPWLQRQIEMIRPKIIFGIGRYASRYLIDAGPDITMGQMRGQMFDYDGIPVCPLYHTAYLLRNPSAKEIFWEDLKAGLRHVNMLPDHLK